jgi:hypothetical protein
MTAVWMGLTTIRSEVDAGRMLLTGNEKLKNAIHQWLGLSPFAVEKKLVNA